MSKQMNNEIITEAKPHTIKNLNLLKDMLMNGLEKFSVMMEKTVGKVQKV